MTIRLRNAVLITFILLMTSFVLAKTKAGYTLELQNRFTIPELPKLKKHIMENYPVCLAVDDSRIYVIDASDTVKTLSYSYDYSGNRLNDFRIPEHARYMNLLNSENNFSYLPVSRQLSFIYTNEEMRRMDFYNLQGELQDSLHVFETREGFLDVGELGNKRYLASISYYGDQDYNKTGVFDYAVRLYEQLPDKTVTTIREIKSRSRDYSRSINWKIFQIDNYDKDLMAVSEVTPFEYIITLHYPDKTDTLRIPWENTYGTPKPMKMFFQFRLGRNFVVIGTQSPGFKYPFSQEIYDFEGNFRGQLKFQDDKKNEIIDIVGDKLFTINPLKGTISIYRIEVR
jgi:hypothetical protein